MRVARIGERRVEREKRKGGGGGGRRGGRVTP